MPRNRQETVQAKRDRFFQESFEFSSKPRFGYFSVPAPLAISEDRTFAPPSRKPVLGSVPTMRPFCVSRPRDKYVLYDSTNEPYRDPVNIFKRKSSLPTDQPSFRVALAIARTNDTPAFSSAARQTAKRSHLQPRGIFTSLAVDRPHSAFPYMPSSPPPPDKSARSKSLAPSPPFRVSRGLNEGVFASNKTTFAYGQVRAASVAPQNTKALRPQTAPFRPAGGVSCIPIVPYVDQGERPHTAQPTRSQSAASVPWKSPPVMPATNPCPSVVLSLSNLRGFLNKSSTSRPNYSLLCSSHPNAWAAIKLNKSTPNLLLAQRLAVVSLPCSAANSEILTGAYRSLLA